VVDAEKEFVAGRDSGGVTGIRGAGGTISGGDVEGVGRGQAGILDRQGVAVCRGSGIDRNRVIRATNDILGVENDDVGAVGVIDCGLPGIALVVGDGEGNAVIAVVIDGRDHHGVARGRGAIEGDRDRRGIVADGRVALDACRRGREQWLLEKNDQEGHQ